MGGRGPGALVAEVAGVGITLDFVGFGAEDAGESPIADGDSFDLHFFEGAVGAEFLGELVEKGLEIGGLFGEAAVLDNEGFGEGAVLEGVPAGAAFAFKGGRAGGNEGVLAVGRDLAFGSNGSLLSTRGDQWQDNTQTGVCQGATGLGNWGAI